MPKQRNGIIHVYRGDGKGKTTAAVGLACRALGRDLKVLFVQFLKSSVTGEVAALQQLGARILRSQVPLGFVFKMNDEEKRQCAIIQNQLLQEASALIEQEKPDLIVLDEVIDAVSLEMLASDVLQEFLHSCPADCELVCTGHVVLEWLEEEAGYVTEMRKLRHPYNEGIAARAGIEF